MNEVVIVSGCRTAVGAFGGSLKNTSVVTLGASVMRETLRKAGLRPVASSAMLAVAPQKLKDQGLIDLETKHHTWDTAATEITLDEVIMGNVLQAGQGQNTARQAMVQAGIAKETPAFTINKVCGSGLKAIALGAQSIMTGQADVVLAGGQENMSMVPMALPKARWGYRMELTGVGEIYDLMVYDALYEIFYGYHMGVTAEAIAQLYKISRADQDERPMETSVEKLAKLKPAFAKDGSVTAGNASGINDGAAAVLLMSATKAKQLCLKPLVTIEGFASGGLDPAYMGLGPVPAIQKALKLSNRKLAEIDLIELNEAFAAQAIGCMLELGIDIEKPNELGSGISMGHPVGCTGARQMVTAMYQMQRRQYATGLISMCIGGGMGMAMVISNKH